MSPRCSPLWRSSPLSPVVGRSPWQVGTGATATTRELTVRPHRRTCESSGTSCPVRVVVVIVTRAWVLGAACAASAVLTACASQASAPRQSSVSEHHAFSRVTGVVLRLPMCPVEPAREVRRCRLVPAPQARVVAYSAGHRAASARSDGHGRFVLVLRPGTYTLRTGYAEGVRHFASRVVDVDSPVESIRLVLDRGARVGFPRR